MTAKEILFCEWVEYTKTNTISQIKNKARIAALSDNTGRAAISYLDRYDKTLRKQKAATKNNINIGGGSDNGSDNGSINIQINIIGESDDDNK